MLLPAVGTSSSIIEPWLLLALRNLIALLLLLLLLPVGVMSLRGVPMGVTVVGTTGVPIAGVRVGGCGVPTAAVPAVGCRCNGGAVCAVVEEVVTRVLPLLLELRHARGSTQRRGL